MFEMVHHHMQQLQDAIVAGFQDDLEESVQQQHQQMQHFLEYESDSDADMEDYQEAGRRRGSQPGRKNVNRDFEGAFLILERQYFGENPLYPERLFERRWGLPRPILNRIYNAVKDTSSFIRKFNPVNQKWGVHTRVKFLAALRLLVTGESGDRQDEYFQLGETTCMDYMKELCREIVEKFGPIYLNRCPTIAEKRAVLELMRKRGFPGAFASWDCKHFVWKNCPVAFAGQHLHHKDKKKSLVLEAISDPFLYIWYFHFGEPGSLNDLNILDKSTIVGHILDQSFDTRVDPYTINRHERDWLYFLTDGIYPKWSIYVKTIPDALRELEKHFKFATRHEHVRKDVERCFGTLIQRFRILQYPLRSWYTSDIDLILRACVIMHNMVMEWKKGQDGFVFNDLQEPATFNDGEEGDENPIDTMERFFEDFDAPVGSFDQMTLAEKVDRVNQSLNNVALHERLQADLVEHIYTTRK